ncbi:regenerating islet-derived protein 4-like isoform 2-T2 [Odontesthes bonariensis]|uniref:regenerating islet-derived protein 4-like isoform X2 n=1 Tax=Odontesthes bonariensis TaxID=219752 RepID=UPI003F58058E
MEDDVNYSDVVFKNNRTPKENKEEQTIYSEVKRKEPATAGSISVMMNQQEAHLRNITEELSRERDDHNRTLGVILKFDNFPVKDFCPDKKCQPCQKGWILHQEKCYLFYKDDHLKTWEGSRKHCIDINSDLVVIDNLQEQEFISEHIESYYDENHGYHIGLRNQTNQQGDNWVWVDGRADTLGYWMNQPFGGSGPFALMIPNRNLTESWDTTDNEFKNRFICEHDKVFIRSL